MEKPALCLVNKMDTEGAEEKLREFKELIGQGYEEAVGRMDDDSRPRRRKAIQLSKMRVLENRQCSFLKANAGCGSKTWTRFCCIFRRLVG